jgi:hypothetical protein
LFCDFQLDLCIRFYIILQGSVNIYRLDDDSPKSIQIAFDTITEFAELDADPEKREELISQAFGNYIVTLGKRETFVTDLSSMISSINNSQNDRQM